jgi:SAM-dependent methyltransferase
VTPEGPNDLASSFENAAWIDRECPLCFSRRNSTLFAESNFREDSLDRFTFASRKLPDYMHARLLNCASCDLLYSSPALEQKLLADCYQKADFDSGIESEFAAQTYAHLLRALVPELPRPLAALDVGCGDGAFLERLLAAGFATVAGIEPSAVPVRAAKPTIRDRIRNGPFVPEDYPVSSFSLITCFQVMEHVWNPLAFCEGAFKLLKPGGLLAVIVHDRRAFSARILGRKSPIFDIEHLQLFSQSSGERLLRNAGFTNISVAKIWNRYPLHYWLKLFPFPRRRKMRIIALSRSLRIGNLSVSMPAGNLLLIGTRS